MHAPAQAAVGARYDIFATDDVGEGENAIRHQFRVLDEIGGVADNAGDEDLSGGQPDIAPDLVFMFVTDIAGFDQVRLRINPEHDIDDIAQGNIGCVGTVPAAPADVIAHPVRRDALQRVIQYFDA